MSRQRTGVLYGAAAYLLWGLFPLYWPLLKPSGAAEILAHRILWSLLIVVGILAVTRNWRWVALLDRRLLALLTGAAAAVAVNWSTYIWGVNSGHVVETSLGYFINPLVSIALGVLLLDERMRPVQWAAVGLAGLAVAVLTVAYGRPPWIALLLAFSFGTYGLLKKLANMGAVESLTVETAVLTLPALAFLLLLHSGGGGSFGRTGTVHALLLVSTGLVTAVPLLFFGAAATRVPLTVIGLLQYFAPVLQFLIGVAVYHEDMPTSRLIGFALVWCALLLLTVDQLAQRRRSVRVPAGSLSRTGS